MKTPDTYRNFHELSRHESPKKDYRIEYINRKSPILVMAPHGGMIEPGTSDIAWEIAGNRFSYYAFKGIKPSNNKTLHISSHRFDEPTAIRAVKQAHTVLTLHGCRLPARPAVLIGGNATDLCHILKKKLRQHGFSLHTPPPHLRAIHPRNLCNRGRAGAGVQLELTQKFRRCLHDSLQWRHRFILAVSSALTVFEKA